MPSALSEQPRVSILIVNWNGGDILRNLLSSIRDFRGDLNVQTIVIDNASIDNSAEMVANQFPDVILECNKQNAGFARGNNQAARRATAPLLLLLNNDTLIRPGSLQKLAQFMDEHPESAAVGPKLIGGDDKPQRSGRNFPTFPALLNSIAFLKWTGIFRGAYNRYRRGGFDPEKPGKIDQLAAAALMVRRDQFEKIGGFDEAFPFGVEDVDLCRRLGRFGSIFYLPDAEIYHLGRVSSRANRGFVYLNYECGWARYLAKHHGRGTARLYKLLVTLDIPVRVIGVALQWPLQRIFSGKEKADRSVDRLKATLFFAANLLRFWKS